MPHAATLATRLAGRPLLLTSAAAQGLFAQVRGGDGREPRRPGLLRGLAEMLSGRAPVRAGWDDDDGEIVGEALGQRLAYAPLWMGEPDDCGFGWTLKDGVALIGVDGALWDEGFCFWGWCCHGYDTLLQAMREAAADERVRAIFLRLKSPGGLVDGGLTELAAFMRDNRAAAGGKPIHVFAAQACSAAYWIAAQADKILAPKVGLIGSIGAVLIHENLASALEKFGVEITAIQFGEHKTDGAWWSALSPTAKADLQAEIDQCGRDFVADVALGRPRLTAEALLATQAAVYMAQHDESARSGLALGFVDEISGEEDAFQSLAVQVSDPQSTGIPVAGGGPAALSSDKDKTMAKPAQTTAGRASALARARAEVARLTAETTADGGEDTMPGEDDEEGAPLAGAAGDDAVTDEAAAIAASAEAVSHPALALAAISSGQTLAQFQASAKAAAAAPKGGHLAGMLANQPRLGPDGVAPAATAPSLSTSAIFEKNRAAGMAARR